MESSALPLVLYPMQHETGVEYAPRPPLYRQRWWKKYLFVLSAVGLAWAAWAYGPGAWRRAQLVYWQGRCMSYEPPRDQPVYFQDSLAAKKRPLPGSGWAFMPVGRRSDTTVAAQVPECWRRLSRLVGTGASGATLFIHKLRTRGGLERLVVVEQRPRPAPPLWFIFETYDVQIAPGTLTTPPRSTGGAISFGDSGHPRVPDPKAPDLIFFAGQHDPEDPSHFTIDYSINGETGVIDGYFDDYLPDRGVVRLNVRNGPAKATGKARVR